jgi:hypothetical protein
MELSVQHFFSWATKLGFMGFFGGGGGGIPKEYIKSQFLTRSGCVVYV